MPYDTQSNILQLEGIRHMLKLSKLEVFSVVAEEGSFSAAAERLHLSQPAVSRHMQELENTLGIRLFKRMRRGVELTRGGEVLREYTQKILWLVGQAEGALTDVSQLKLGQMRMISTPGVGVYMLPNWVRTFTTKYPNLTVSLTTQTTSGVIENVLLGRCDLGIVEGEVDTSESNRLGVVVLQPLEWVVVVGSKYPWGHQGTVNLQDLKNMPFVTRQTESHTRLWLDSVFNKYDLSVSYVGEFDNPEAIKEAVMNHMGITILPTYAVAREVNMGYLKTIPIQDAELKRHLRLVWDKERPFSPVSRAFLSQLAEQYTDVKAIIPPVLDELFS